MKAIFKLSLMTTLKGKIGILLIVLSVGLPFVLPELSNYEVSGVGASLARAQAAWQVAWVFGGFWLLFQGAKLGAEYTSSGMGVYFTSGGVDSGKQLTAIWLSVAAFAICLVLSPLLVVLCTTMPDNTHSAEHYAVLGVQQVCFMLLVLLPLVLFAITLASRFNVIVGYLISLGLLLVGFYGVTTIGKVAAIRDHYVLDFFYVVLPHFHLGDLTHRFVHMQGALTSKEFFTIFEYLAGWAMITSGVSCLGFSVKQR